MISSPPDTAHTDSSPDAPHKAVKATNVLMSSIRNEHKSLVSPSAVCRLPIPFLVGRSSKDERVKVKFTRGFQPRERALNRNRFSAWRVRMRNQGDDRNRNGRVRQWHDGGSGPRCHHRAGARDVGAHPPDDTGDPGANGGRAGGLARGRLGSGPSPIRRQLPRAMTSDCRAHPHGTPDPRTPPLPALAPPPVVRPPLLVKKAGRRRCRRPACLGGHATTLHPFRRAGRRCRPTERRPFRWTPAP
jgi:hypothetical protein